MSHADAGVAQQRGLTNDERARCEAALVEVIGGSKAVIDVLTPALRGLDGHASRRRVKDVIIGVAVLRLRLSHRAGSSDVGALIDAFFADDGRGVEVGADDDLGLDTFVRTRSVPPHLAQRLFNDLGPARAHTFMVAQNQPGPTTLRANRRRGDRLALQARLADEGVITTINPHAPDALDVVGHANLFGVAAFREGYFEVQDSSSQRVALACALGASDDVVVDVCAGRGGKTLALSATAGFRGRVIATDIDDAALRDLRGRLGRAGADNVDVVARDALVEGRADVVLVDTPCSSSGVWRRFPDRRYQTTEQEVKDLVVLQRSLLREAVRLCRPGGRVVYATCSVFGDEGQGVVDHVAADGDIVVDSAVQLVPGGPTDGDGFFIATARRRAAG